MSTPAADLSDSFFLMIFLCFVNEFRNDERGSFKSGPEQFVGYRENSFDCARLQSCVNFFHTTYERAEYSRQVSLG